MARPDPLANRKGLMGRGTCFFNSLYSAPRVNRRPTTRVYNLNATVVRDRGSARRGTCIPKDTLHNLRYAIAKSCRQKNLRAYEMGHRRIAQGSVILTAWAPQVPHPMDGGLTMRSNIVRYAKRMIVALGIAVVVVIAISDVVAYSSSVERAWVINERLTSPLRPPVPKAEFRLSEYRQLEGHFFQRQPLR